MATPKPTLAEIEMCGEGAFVNLGSPCANLNALMARRACYLSSPVGSRAEAQLKAGLEHEFFATLGDVMQLPDDERNYVLIAAAMHLGDEGYERLKATVALPEVFDVCQDSGDWDIEGGNNYYLYDLTAEEGRKMFLDRIARLAKYEAEQAAWVAAGRPAVEMPF